MIEPDIGDLQADNDEQAVEDAEINPEPPVAPKVRGNVYWLDTSVEEGRWVPADTEEEALAEAKESLDLKSGDYVTLANHRDYWEAVKDSDPFYWFLEDFDTNLDESVEVVFSSGDPIDEGALSAHLLKSLKEYLREKHPDRFAVQDERKVVIP